MKTLLFISLLFICHCAFGQTIIQEVNDKKIVARIEYIKSKTDSFLLTRFLKNVRSKFRFEFSRCGYFRGEMHSMYYFLNSDKSEPEDLTNLTHNYNFNDKDINLTTDVTIYFFEGEKIELRFQTTEDSLKYAALDKIYNKGIIANIRTKTKEVHFKYPYVIIDTNKKTKKFTIILKDKVLPHVFFID